LTVAGGDDTIKSGLPRAHSTALANLRGGGKSAGLPSGAPLSAQAANSAISSSLRDGSSLNCWMPMFFSMNHGGIAPRPYCDRASAVRCFIARAYGRACS
jgi:hypothetical protein